MHRLIVCASVPTMDGRVRMNKLKEVFLNNGIEFLFWGWRREKTEYTTEYPLKHLWTGGGYANKGLLFHYPFWIMSVFFNALKLKKSDKVYAVAFDVALPIYLASKIKGFDYIFDNPDNFSLTYNLKGVTKRFIDNLEKKIAKNALYHIVPDRSRVNEIDEKTVVIPNFPLTSELEKAKVIFKEGKLDDIDIAQLKDDKRLKIYINGRMVKQRGSEWIAKTIEKLDPDKFLFIVAGNVLCDTLNDTIKKSKNVIKFSRMENYKALSLYFCSDLVFAFYDPALPINKKAAPNKWWDCVACGVPFVTNDGIETAKEFVEKEACFQLPYGSDRLVDLLKELERNKEEIEIKKNNLKNFETYNWEHQILKIIKEIT